MGAPLTTAGIPEVRLVYVPADRVKIHDETSDWVSSLVTASPARDPPVGISLARFDHAAFSATLNFNRRMRHENPG